jgi:hypothetical protein
VYGAVVRADDLLTGMLTATAIVLGVCEILLVRDGTRAATILAVLVAAACLIRSRLYPIVKQRLTWLSAGASGVTALVIEGISADRATLVVPLVLLLAAGAIVIGLRYSARPPNPYLSRAAEILELLVMLTLVPVVSGVLGLYGLLRGWGG